MSITNRIIIKLPSQQQTVIVGNNLDNEIERQIKKKKYTEVVFIVDKNVNEKWPSKIERLKKLGKVLIIEPRLQNKEFNYCKKVIKFLLECKVNRKSCVVAVGGGYVGDVAGFVASTYMRGIDFIQVPTTFMAMGDPVIGKVAINFSGLKNILGAFYSPVFTFCDVDYLESLTAREITLGLVEVWKSALVTNNNQVIEKINRILRTEKYQKKDLIFLAEFSIRKKKFFVELDWNDKIGLHKALSLGHTFSNYLESKFKIRHGEGVCYGILLSAILSKNLNKIDSVKYTSIKESFSLFDSKFKLLQRIQRKMSKRDIKRKISFDKINVNKGKFSFVVLTKDKFNVKDDVSLQVLEKTMTIFKKFNNGSLKYTPKKGVLHEK